jgi:nicotinic acetylcholine receptor beta-4
MSTKKISAKDRLIRDLTTDYNADVEPEDTELSLGISAITASYDKGSKELTLAVWELHVWKDLRLSWNPEDYNGVKVVRIPARRVWIPDTKLYNSSTALLERDADVNVVAYSNGRVLWVPRTNYRIQANEQANGEINGVIKVGSWTYRDVDVPVKLEFPQGLNLEYLDPSSRYTITDPTAKIEQFVCEGENYPAVVINFIAKPNA